MIKISGLLFTATLLIGCSQKVEVKNSAVDSVAGKLRLNTISGQSSDARTISDTCSNQTVSLYSLKSSGEKDVKLSETIINPDGSYAFKGLRSKGFSLSNRGSSGTKYLIEYDCNSEIYQRFITGATEQNLSEGTSLMGWLTNTPAGSKITSKDSTTWELFYKEISVLSSATEAFSNLNSNETMRAAFISAFGINPSALITATPKIRSLNVPTSSMLEGQAYNLSAVATHWSLDYDIAYIWKIGSQVISTSNALSFTPHRNLQGPRTIQLFIGKDNGSGNIDTSLPYIQRQFDLTVENTYPATLPAAILLSSTYTNSPVAQVRLSTGGLVGGIPIHCSSFSKMGWLEESAPGIMPSAVSFDVDCTQNPNQNLNLTLSGVEGARVLRFWAQDSSGNISASTDIAVNYDITPPVYALTQPHSGQTLKGGSITALSWSLTEANPTGTQLIEHSTDNGLTWQTITTANPGTTTYNWTIPTTNTLLGKWRISTVDAAGNLGSATSSGAFAIDSIAPPAPSITIASSASTNSSSILLSNSHCTEASHIYFSETPSVPSESSLQWQPCATGNFVFTVSAGDGNKSIYAYLKDTAGNISTSGTASITLDQTGPALSINSSYGGQFLSGNPTQVPPINIKTMSISASDTLAGLNNSTLTVQHCLSSCGSETSWQDHQAGLTITSVPQNINWQVPHVNSTNVSIRLRAADLVGNISTSSAISVSIDSTPPLLASTSINENEDYAGTAQLSIKTNITDNLSLPPHTELRIDQANPTTQDCQSQFVNSNWVTFVDGNTSHHIMVAPIDGTKKICVWAKDRSGNITVHNPSAGSLGLNMDTIIFQMGNPPSISNLSVTRNLGGTVATIGDAMTISWSATDAEGLNNSPISFAYTTDNVLWRDILTNADIKSPSNVTWFGELSENPTIASSNVTSWTAPSNGYFRLRAIARDQSGGSSIPILSQIFNAGAWNVFAGSRDRGIGGSGGSAALYQTSLARSIAIHPMTGDIYAVDESFGIKKLNAVTGLVSQFIENGPLNIVNGGTLPINPTLPVGNSTSIVFDNGGRLYVVTNNSYSNSVIYQINLETGFSRLYAGGGTNNDGGVLSTSLRIGNTYTFDEANNMYVITQCAPFVHPFNQGKRVLKISQNGDATPSTVTRVIGDCSFAAPNYGTSAFSSPAGNFSYIGYSNIVAFNNGNNIYFESYLGVRWKIINGVVYSVNFGSNSCGGIGSIAYSPSNGKLYHSNSTCGIDEITLSLTAQNNGESRQTLFSGNSTTSGCTNDGIVATSACTKISWLGTSNNYVYFSDGASVNSASFVRVRYIDSENRPRTVFGSLPFFGDGLSKNVIRGTFAGIHYKKSTDPLPTEFPPGLYFTDPAATVFGYIDESTSLTSVLWGNQSRLPGGFASGNTISKDLSLGAPYGGGSLYSLAFDNNGHPWLRAETQLFSINSQKQIVSRTTGSSYWDTLADGANPRNSWMHVYGGMANLTLKSQGLFAIGAAYATVGFDPNISIRLLDFGGATTQKLMGGSFVHSQSQLEAADASSNIPQIPLRFDCYFNNCFTQYDETTDRLYFSENTKIRYITSPSNTATSTLVTEFTQPSAQRIFNFTFRPGIEKQIWYATNATTLFCHDISSGKSWCDDTTNHFSSAAAAGYSFNPRGSNMFTWKDNGTLLLSTFSGEILQLNLPAGP